MAEILESVIIPTSSTVEGLKPSTLSKLSDVNVVCGPNGGGKTRFLRFLHQSVLRFRHFRDTFGDMRLIKRDMLPNQHRIDLEEQGLLDLRFRTDVPSITAHYIRPAARGMADPSGQPFSDIISGQHASKFGVAALVQGYEDTLNIIYRISAKFAYSDSKHANFSSEELANTEEQFEKLRSYIGSLLSLDLHIKNGVPHLDEWELHKSASILSDGQRWLLHVCATMFNKASVSDPVIVLLDEPELFMHPASTNDVIDRLISAMPQGQFFVATHSLPLIAHLGFELCWYAKGGHLMYAGRAPEMIIDGLTGGARSILRLRELLYEPEAAALARFALEALCQPTVAVARTGDPQEQQLRKALTELSSYLKRPVKVLDFGAGRGRFLSIASSVLGDEHASTFDYYAFDIDPTPDLISEIVRVYGDEAQRVASDSEGLQQLIENAPFDAVIICNVLHESEPSKWESVFRMLRHSCHAESRIIIAEDLQLPHGEHAHRAGFVLADATALAVVFDVAESDITYFEAERQTNRLMCVTLEARHLDQMSRKSIVAALECIASRAKDRVQQIRLGAKELDYKRALEHALHLHQFANATIAIDLMATSG